MTTQLNILFMALHSRVNDNGEVPVYCRLMYNQRQKRFMIGCTVPIEMWRQSKQRAFGKSAKAATVNQHVNLTLQKIYKAEAELLKQSEPFEVEDIITKVQGNNKSGCRTLMELFHHRYKRMKKLEGTDYKESTIRKFVQATNSIKLFLKEHYESEDISLSKMNIAFLHHDTRFVAGGPCPALVLFYDYRNSNISTAPGVPSLLWCEQPAIAPLRVPAASLFLRELNVREPP